MPKVVISDTAEKRLRALAPDDRAEVRKWCDELKTWRPDNLKFLSRTIGINSTFMLRTDADTRLVFTTDTKGITKPAKVITIMDVMLSGDAVRQRTLEHARRAKRARQAHAL
jgi:mRNA-degrading endonuclease RelE of RelBE toxin-antitoxin system